MSSFSSSFPTRHPGASRSQGPVAAGAVYGSTSSRMAPRLVNGRAPDQPQVSLGRFQHSSSHSRSQHPSSPGVSQLPSSHQAAPRIQPSHNHDASTSVPVPSEEGSDEDLRSTGSNGSDCDSADDSHSSDSLFASSPPKRTSTRQAAATKRAKQALPSSRPCIRWSSAEDKLLMSSVEKHGRDWEEISKVFAKAGGPKRVFSGISQRYFKLIKQQQERQEEATAAMRKSSAARRPKQQSKTASSIQTTTFAAAHTSWTPEEEQKLSEIAKRVERRRVYSEWRKAFPITVRSDFAVLKRYDRMIKEMREREGEAKQGGRLNGGGCRAEGATASARSASGSALSPTSQFTRGKSSSHAASTSTMQAPSSSGQGSGAGGRSSYRQSSSSNDAAVPHLASAQHDSSSSFAGPEDEVIDPTAQSARPFDCEKRQPPSPPITDYTITCHPTGVLVQDFPPLHHLLILAPGVCRVVGPTVGPQGGLEHQQQLTAQQLACPFVFRVKADGSIQGVVLPLGTTTSIALHRGQPQIVELEEGAGVVETQASTYVETTFSCEDGWTVVFRSVQLND